MALLWSARCVINPLSRVQSRYIRHFLDVPWQGVAMPLHLHTRRFFCDTIDGLRCIFPERFPAIIAPYARRTLRLTYCFPSRGLVLGGDAGLPQKWSQGPVDGHVHPSKLINRSSYGRMSFSI